MDVGGGSTELILGELDGTVRVARSLDMGSVRIRERFLGGDPPTADEISTARDFVDGLLDSSDVPIAGAATWIGVAGTSTSLSAISQGLVTYDRVRVHNSTVEVAEIDRLSEQLLATPIADVMTTYPMLQRLRAEVICAGALIVAQVAARVGVAMTVRETDILDGATLELLRR
jgi:exopolyphosphatase/guanosine-5'-triphosphate,3'-diphosphate pyrophosphatase